LIDTLNNVFSKSNKLDYVQHYITVRLVLRVIITRPVQTFVFFLWKELLLHEMKKGLLRQTFCGFGD